MHVSSTSGQGHPSGLQGFVHSMLYRAVARCLIFVLLITSVPLNGRPASAASPTAQDTPAANALTIGRFNLVGSKRVARALFTYTYTAPLHNAGTESFTRVRARLTSLAPATTVIDGELSFGDVLAGATVLSQDTFTIQQDRTQPFNPAALVWTFSYNGSPLANAGPDQSIRVGETASLDGGGSTDPDSDALSYQWSLLSTPAGSRAALDGATTANPRFVPDQAGAYVVQLIVRDGALSSPPDTVTVTAIADANRPPAITSTPPTAATVGQLYSYDVEATDPDGDALTFSLTAAPAGMAIDAATGLIQWTPTPAQVGNQSIAVHVQDSQGLAATQSFEIAVTSLPPVNHPPTITSTPFTAATVDQLYSYAVVATDPDAGDTLTFSLVTAPAGMSIDAATGLTAWTPTEAQAGAHPVTVKVQDPGGLFATQEFTVTVAASQPDNHPPTITSTAPTTATVGQLYSYDVEATDADGDALTFALTAAPAGMTIDAATGLIQWTPTPAQAGNQSAAVQVQDSRGLSATQSFELAVTSLPVNRPPTITSTPLTAATVGQLYRYAVAASDPDGDVLTFALTAAPAGVVIDAQTGLVEWTPAADQVGTHEIAIQVQDTGRLLATQTYQITVSALLTCVAPPPGLVSWWPGDGDGTDIVDGNQGSPNRGASFGTGIVGQAFQLNGDDQYLEIPDNPNQTPPDGLTLEGWVNPNRVDGIHPIIAKYHTATSTADLSWFFGVHETGDHVGLRFGVYSGPPGTATVVTRDVDIPGPVLAVGRWQHVAATFDAATQEMRIYVDGVSIPTVFYPGSGTVPRIGDSPGTVQIGSYSPTLLAPHGWDGLLDELSLYNRALSADEIRAIFAAGEAGKCKAGLVANAGSDQTVPVEQTVTLDGSGSRRLDGGPLAFHWSLLSAPSGSQAALNDPTAVQPTFTADQAGRYLAQLIVSDGVNDSAPDTVVITAVEPENNPPAITSTPPTEASVGQFYSYDVEATDPDGDALTFSLTVAPAGMAIDAASGLIQWMPTPAQAGEQSVVVRVEDSGGLAATQSFKLGVTSPPVNHPPAITSTPPTAATAGQVYTYAVQATDLDAGDTLTFSLVTAPAGMTIDPATGLIQWTPTEAQVGEHPVSVKVQDRGGLFVTQDFTLVVAPPNHAPVITAAGIAPQWMQLAPSGTAPTQRVFSVSGYDAVNDRLIVFGGGQVGGANDIWVLVNATGVTDAPSWVQLAPVGGPPQARSLAAAVYDPTANRLIVYGGCTGTCGTILSDVWVLTHANGLGGAPEWIRLPSGAPSTAAGAAYDPISNRMMVFGGLSASSPSDLNTVRVLVDANGVGNPHWIDLTPNGTLPPPRSELQNLAYDPTTNRLIVFGGYSKVSGTEYNDAWVLTNANGLGGTPEWQPLSPQGTPPAIRSDLPISYDPNSNRLIIFGGLDRYSPGVTYNYDDTWVLTNANGLGGTPEWIKLEPTGPLPTGRFGYISAYDTRTNRLAVALGENDVFDPRTGTFFNDVWVLTNASGYCTANQPCHYDVDATDPDAGDALTYALDSGPAGMTIDPASGLITWTPTPADTGNHPVTVRVTDSGGLSATQSFTLTVAAVAVPNVQGLAPEWGEALLQAAGLSTGAKNSLGGAITLNFDTLPSQQGWSYWAQNNSAPEDLVFWLEDGVLHQNTIGTGFQGQGSNRYRFKAVVDNRLPFTFLTRSRVLQDEGNTIANSFGFFVGLFIGKETFGIGLGPTRIQDQKLVFLSTTANNTVFHNFYLEGIPGEGYSLFVDDALLVTGSTIFLTFENGIDLGDGTGGTNAEAEIAFYYFTQSKITAQTPAPGTLVANGTPVDLNIQEGPATQTVPNVVGQPQANAQSAIMGAQLAIGTVTTESSNTVPAGSVIRQRPVAGTKIMKDFKVDLVVSSGTANHLPEITSTASITATVGQFYSYDVEATDPDGDTLTFSLTTAPTGMTINAATGLIQWTPTSAQAGSHNVTVRVEDGKGGFATQSFTVAVSSLNQAPAITSTPVTSATAGSPYIYDVEATDPDPGDTLIYSLPTAPTGMTIDPATGLIQWTPTAAQVGNQPVTVRVQDNGGLAATQSFEIVVTAGPVNHPPQITLPAPILEATVGQPYSLDIDATDPDTGDTLTFSLTAAPGGMTINTTTGLIQWTPTSAQAGSHNVTVRVEDGKGGFATQSFTVAVTSLNQAPVAVDDQFEAEPGQSVNIAAPGVLANDEDADGDPLQAILVQPPANGTVNLNSDGSFTYTPNVPTPGAELDVVLKWAWTSSTILPDALNVMMPPAIIDLNGDGVPDVVFGSTSGGGIEIGYLRAVRGDTGAELFTITEEPINTTSTIAVGDIDGDGKPEIIACDSSGRRLIAFEHDGSFKWRSPDLEPIGWGAPALADLDQDGLPEIIIGRQVLNHDGTLRWTGTGGRGSTYGFALSLVTDINLDGKPEIVAGNTVYSSTGSILWQASTLPDGLNAVGNFDDDPFAEIVLVSNGQVYLLEHDGALKRGPVPIPDGGMGGPPTVADFDGDGQPEIGVAGATRYAVFETDGSLKWAAVTQDRSSNVTGSSVFDFQGDGSAEVIYRDELKLRVYRGTDGVVLFETPMSSCTWYEYPLVADVDGDGHAEIVVGANNNCGFGPQRGVYVFGDALNRWVPTRRIWNQHTYHITNVNEDGTIPQFEQNNWLIPGLNNFRLNAFAPADTAQTDSFTYKATDGRLDSNVATVTLTVAQVNHPPGITSAPVLSAVVDQQYRYDVEATDSDAGDTLTYSLPTAPDGVTIDPTTGLIQWTPTAAQVGNQPVTVRVQDSGGLSVSQSFTVTVAPATGTLPVPDVIGSTQTQAQAALTAANLSVGTVTEVDNRISLGFTSLPSAQGWLYGAFGNSASETQVFSLTNGVLQQNTLGLGVTQGLNVYQLPEGVQPKLPFVLTVTARVLQQEGDPTDAFGFAFGVVVDSEQVAIGLRTNGVHASGGTVLTTTIDTTQFHEYRIEGRPGAGFRVFVDGVLVGSGTASAGDAVPFMFLGDASGTANARGEIKALSFVQGQGLVIDQQPDAGTLVTPNFPVNLLLAQTPPPVTVPDVVGQPQATAQANLLAAKLLIGAITTAHSTTIPAGSVISQTPAAGSSVPELTAVDLVVSLGTGQVTVPNVVGSTQAAATTALQQANLTVGAITTAPSDTVPAGQVISQTPAAGASVAPGSAVALVISSGAPSVPLQSIVVQPNPALLLVGQTQAFTATGLLTDGTSQNVTGQVVWESTNPTVASIGVNGVATALAEGTTTVRATQGTITGTATLTVRASAGGDTTLPTALIISPVNDATLTGPTPITGTATDESFFQYVLEIAPAGETTFTPLATGTAPVTNGTLGTLDTTLLLNDLYTLRLTVYDRANNRTETSILVQVSREQKVGNFTLAFQDLNIPVACLPLTVTRVYDSRDKGKGDFGVGWRLDVQTLRLRESHTMGTGWHVDFIQKPGPFGSRIPTYVLVDDAVHKVSLTLPDGHVEQFDLNPQPRESQFNEITVVTTGYTARPGTLGSLASVGDTEWGLSGATGTVEFLNSDGDLFDPRLYRYTTPEGNVFTIDRFEGVKSVQCTNGQTLTVGPNGITHSSGKGVSFTRDSQGRITRITDPNGNVQEYTYDANGDLITHTDAQANRTQFSYDYRHGLLEIQDPRGVRAIRNEYDDTGRLISSTDAAGNPITYQHDLVARKETVTDRLGHSTAYEYDDKGNVLKQTDALGRVTTFTYDEFGNQLSKIDPLGRTTTSEYDSRRNVLSETDPLSHTTRYTYTALNAVRTVTDPLGRTTTNTYDAQGNLTETLDPMGQRTRYVYDTGGVIIPNAGLLKERTDPLGHKTTYDYDSAGNLTRETDSLGQATTYTYDANNNRLSETRTRTLPGGATETLVTRFEYDGNNRLVKTIHPDGSTTQTVYNAIGKQAQTVDPLGRVTQYEYDDLGRLVKTTYPDGTTETSTYDAEGRRIASTDRAGRATQYVYDALGRLTETQYSDGAEATTTYDAAGQVIASTDALGQVTRYEYDLAGRRTQAIDALSHATVFTYDAVGNQITVRDANGNTLIFAYDLNNRRTRVTYPDGTFEDTGYDALGRQTSKTDQAGLTTQFGYDALGRLVSVTDALGEMTSYAYDESGNQISQTDAEGRTTRFEYDRMSRRTKRTLPLGMSEAFQYDAAGNLIRKTDFNGRTTVYAYDTVNRLLSRAPDPALGEPTISFTYTTTGQRATMADTSGTTTYEYDERDRLTRKVTPQGTLDYSYDAAGSLTSIDSSNTGGVSIDYEYDARNRLSRVTDDNGSTTYGYDAVGNLASFAYPNGVETRYTYNTLNRLTQVTASKTSTLASFTYTLGPAGNRTSVTELSGRRADYGYDALYRLTSEIITGDLNPGGNGNISYLYDRVGNRLSRTSTVAGIANQSFSYDANDRITSETYDDNGNTLASEGRSFGYDAENRLTSADGGVSFVYDGDGNRVAKTVGGVTTQFLVDDRNPTGYAQVLEEVVGGNVERRYTYGLKLISQSQAGGVSFYGYDGHGSVRFLTDAGGSVTDTYTYDAFGNLISQMGGTGNAYLYAGEQVESSIALYYLRARDYASNLGRFGTVDRFAGRLANPLTLHAYTHVQNDPINRYDPSGNFTLADVSLTTTIQGILRTTARVKGFFALKSAKERLAVGIGIAEVLYAFLQPERTNVGWEVSVKFRDPLDRRFKPTVRISCTIAPGSTRFCDQMELSVQPRAGIPEEFSVAWDFTGGTFSYRSLIPGIGLSYSFTLLETSIADLNLTAELDVFNKKANLNFAFSAGGPKLGKKGGSMLRTNFDVTNWVIPDDIENIIDLLK